MFYVTASTFPSYKMPDFVGTESIGLFLEGKQNTTTLSLNELTISLLN